MEGILDVFLSIKDENGLIRKFSDNMHWNFYDWSAHLAGKLFEADEDTPDLVLNCLFTMALDSFEIMCKKADIPFKYEGMADTLRQRIGDAFLNENGLFSHYEGKNVYTVLGNSLAILCGAVTGSAAKKICDKIVRGELFSSSLSMNVFKYEALIQTSERKYKSYVLEEIRANYKQMLDSGSDTVWETIIGADDFGGAGSLCHGWSAVPVYFYHKLSVADYL
jgi:hypothetical protein